MNLPENIYFMDRDSIMQRMNDRTAETSGYLSATDGIGKSILDVSKRETVARILENDREVIRTGRFKIDAESYIRHDGVDMIAVSIKFPWLQNNEIAGIFGCSILLGDNSGSTLSQTLNMFMQTGLFTAEVANSVPVLNINESYFDERDQAIMYWLVRGKTAKNIARALGLSFRTIEHRLESIKYKLQVRSKAELIECIIDKFIYLPTANGS